MTLPQLWALLRQVRTLSFVAASASKTGWNGPGVGMVEVKQVAEAVITFSESGTWRPRPGEREVRFSNVYRWTMVGGMLRLEHLRFGEASPVHLLDLAQVGEREWRPTSPHICRHDCYTAVLTVRDNGIVLCWSIDGPRKKETIEYVYTGSGIAS